MWFASQCGCQITNTCIPCTSTRTFILLNLNHPYTWHALASITQCGYNTNATATSYIWHSTFISVRHYFSHSGASIRWHIAFPACNFTTLLPKTATSNVSIRCFQMRFLQKISNVQKIFLFSLRNRLQHENGTGFRTMKNAQNSISVSGMHHIIIQLQHWRIGCMNQDKTGFHASPWLEEAVH